MIQPIRRQARMPLLVLLAVALATLASISLTRISTGATTSATTGTQSVTPAVVTTEGVVSGRPVLRTAAAKPGCSSDTYVSGDLAGDASPATLYAALCGKP